MTTKQNSVPPEFTGNNSLGCNQFACYGGSRPLLVIQI